MENQQPPRRLCSEIQLFDLCDLDECSKKEGRYCTDPKTLERFEAIKEEDERSQYLPEEMEEEEGEEGEDDEFGGDEYEEDEY